MEVRKIGPKASLEQAETAADQDLHQVRRRHLSMLSCHVGFHYYTDDTMVFYHNPPSPETEKKQQSQQWINPEWTSCCGSHDEPGEVLLDFTFGQYRGKCKV